MQSTIDPKPLPAAEDAAHAAIGADQAGAFMSFPNGSSPMKAGPGTAPPPPILSSAPSALVLLKALQHRWLRAFTTAVLCAALVSLVTWLIMPTPKSTARTLLRVPPEGKFLLSTSEPVPELTNHQRTQMALVKTRLVLNGALKQPKVAELSLMREQLDPVEWLERQVQVDFSVAPEVLRIAISGDRPEELVVLVDAVREAYRREIVDKERLERNDRLNKLGELREKFDGQLRARKEEQRDLEQKAGSHDASARALMVAFTQQETNVAERELLQTRSELRKARLEQTTQEANEKKLPELTVPDTQLDEQIDKEPGIKPFLQESDRLRFLIDETIKKSAGGENDPSVERYREKLAFEQKAMDAFRQKRRPQFLRQLQEKAKAAYSQNALALESRISFLEEQERTLGQEIERLRDKVQEMTKNSIKLEAFREDLSQLEAITKKIAFEEEALKVELQAPSRIRVLEEAVLQHSDNRNRLATTMGLASAGTLGLILLGFAWWEFRARRIDSPEEVAQGLGIKVVGAIPDSTRLSWTGRGEPNRDIEDLLTESIDATRTMLLEVGRSRSLRVVVITSAEPGEGKTSTATRLAVSLAQIGYKTLLIDGDLRNPMAHRVLNVPNDPGLCELLRGEIDVAKAVQSTSVPALSMISAGTWDCRATQALPQERAATAFQRLRDTFDFILIDSSPMLPVVDPLLLAKHADGALLSVLCNVSRMQNVYAAHQRLAALGVPSLGAVVSGVRGEVYTKYYKYVTQTTT